MWRVKSRGVGEPDGRLPTCSRKRLMQRRVLHELQQQILIFLQRRGDQVRPPAVQRGARASSTRYARPTTSPRYQSSGSSFTMAAPWLLPNHTETGIVWSSIQMLRMLV